MNLIEEMVKGAVNITKTDAKKQLKDKFSINGPSHDIVALFLIIWQFVR